MLLSQVNADAEAAQQECWQRRQKALHELQQMRDGVQHLFPECRAS